MSLPLGPRSVCGCVAASGDVAALLLSVDAVVSLGVDAAPLAVSGFAVVPSVGEVGAPMSTPGIENASGGGCGVVSLMVLAGAVLVPGSIGGVSEPTTCANAVPNGERIHENARTTAKSFRSASNFVILQKDLPRPIVKN